jgi:ribosomal protection tetracycline resistance protein
LARTLNLGILAHVDAGKTSLTERLLHDAGVIDELGSVDAGNTRTDSLALERQRGITIRSAVVGFTIGDLAVNLIDTPGHPDFIAEVERVLDVLDGVVLVVSAVEGVQPQTRVLTRVLQRMRIPTIVFVNKADRVGARYDGLLHDFSTRLTATVVPMGTPTGLGTRDVAWSTYDERQPDVVRSRTELLADGDDDFLAAAVDGAVDQGRVAAELAAQTRRAVVHPVFCGSAVTGAGVRELAGGIAELLPAGGSDGDDQPVSGTVFKIERGPARERICYLRMFAGTLHVRDKVSVPSRREQKVTALRRFEDGTVRPAEAVTAGEIALVSGLDDCRVGDPVGVPRPGAATDRFPPPTLETVVVPRDRREAGALHTALT